MGRARTPLQQDANTEDGAEAHGKRLSRGLKLQLNPGRQSRGSAEGPPPDQQRTSGERSAEDWWREGSAPSVGGARSPPPNKSRMRRGALRPAAGG
ncbi:hypothetical protein NDU88_011039 [Pleurodeles waltl]|uniref:Uncharacterized protein n=1 Tax=Pleurodeles waltl TaxID=8319 RepID=A0AAV7PXB3_PLEWA|nr:hypothetical protein NDU88_011039 [Pleurodeles waltl]